MGRFEKIESAAVTAASAIVFGAQILRGALMETPEDRTKRRRSANIFAGSRLLEMDLSNEPEELMVLVRVNPVYEGGDIPPEAIAALYGLGPNQVPRLDT